MHGGSAQLEQRVLRCWEVRCGSGGRGQGSEGVWGWGVGEDNNNNNNGGGKKKVDCLRLINSGSLQGTVSNGTQPNPTLLPPLTSHLTPPPPPHTTSFLYCVCEERTKNVEYFFLQALLI